MKVIPLDVTVEQATKSDPAIRFVRIDYVEIANPAPITKRAGDNDDAINHPVANFSFSDTTPARDQVITITDTSTGQYDSWDWSVGTSGSQAPGKFYGPGPHRFSWSAKGTYEVKLRVYGAETADGSPITSGAQTRTKKITVH
jgi:PKD repeat protein